MHYCRFVHESSGLEDAFREILEERLFEFFHDNAASDETGLPASDPESRAVTAVLDRLCRTATVEGYTRGNRELSERAAHEAVAWCANRMEQGRSDGRFVHLDPLEAKAAEPGLAAEDAEALLDETRRMTGDSRELGFLRRHLAELRSSAAPVAEYMLRAATSAARREVRRLLDEKKRSNIEAVFAESFPAFVDEMNDLLPRLAGIQEKLENLFGAAGRLWDRELKEWEAVDWPTLEEEARALESEESIKRLAAVLGKMSRAAAPQPETAVAVSVTTTESVAIGRSEIDGVAMGNDLGSLTTQELALLADEDTSALFDKRFADSELLIRAYKTREDRSRGEIRWETRGGGSPREEGPIILCVDTSGSMAGEPERVAKLATLALTRAAVSAGRLCYLIFFSTTIHCIEVSDLGSSLSELSEYLGGYVRGGTDVAPALRRSAELLATESYKNADVLVVSDFRIPKIPGEVRRLVEERRDALGTRFHILTVTDKPVRDTYFLFDYRWHYDISSPRAPGIAPESFRLLR